MSFLLKADTCARIVLWTLLAAAAASAHPGSGIVVDPQGQVLFTDTGHAVCKVDANGNWKGWAAKGETTMIPCNGTVGEVTFKD